MITNENLDHLVATIAESGLKISKETLQENFKKFPDGFQMNVTRQGKKGLEDSTLFFNKSDKGIFTHTEIKEENFSYLVDLLRDTKIPASVIPKVRENMAKGLAEFHVDCPSTVNNVSTHSKLNFSLSPTNGFYYWNNYKFKLLARPEGDLSGMEQTVFISNDKAQWANNYKPYEMTRLLLGEAITKELVSKEGKHYFQERSLNFNGVDKHENFIKEKVLNQTNPDQPKQETNSRSAPLNHGTNQMQKEKKTTKKKSGPKL